MKINVSRRVLGLLCCLLLLLPFFVRAQRHPFPQQEFTVRGFEKLSVEGKFRVTLVPSQQERVLVMLDEGNMKKVSVDLKGKNLCIRGKKKALEDFPPVPVRIEYVKLDNIRISGAAHVVVPETLRSMNLVLDLQDEAVLQGSFLIGGKASLEMKDMARIEGRVDAVKKGRIGISGMAEARIKGYVPELELKLSDMGKLSAPELLSDKVEARLSDVSEARLAVNKQLKAQVEDAARLRYGGQPKLSVSSHGSATVSALK